MSPPASPPPRRPHGYRLPLSCPLCPPCQTCFRPIKRQGALSRCPFPLCLVSLPRGVCMVTGFTGSPREGNSRDKVKPTRQVEGQEELSGPGRPSVACANTFPSCSPTRKPKSIFLRGLTPQWERMFVSWKVREAMDPTQERAEVGSGSWKKAGSHPGPRKAQEVGARESLQAGGAGLEAVGPQSGLQEPSPCGQESRGK